MLIQSSVLIVPSGIETVMKTDGASTVVVLIVPSGIETVQTILLYENRSQY